MKAYEAPKGGRYFRDPQTGRRVLAEGAEAVGHFVSPAPRQARDEKDAAPAEPSAPAADEGKKTGKGK